MNRLLTSLSAEIMVNNGTIDKYMGDSVMAFWNAPLSDPDHALDACKSALSMVDALDPKNNVWQEVSGGSDILTIGNFEIQSRAYIGRSEERRVGKECVSTCRSRWSPSHSKKKQKRIKRNSNKK